MTVSVLPTSPSAFAKATWGDVAPFFDELAARPLEPANIEAWLTKVVVCRATDWLRDHGRRNQVCLTTIPDEPVAKLSEDQRLAIITVLERLPKRYRVLVEARYFEGHTEEEAAQLAGLSPASYKKTMTRALTRMREELERGCREKPAGKRKLP